VTSIRIVKLFSIALLLLCLPSVSKATLIPGAPAINTQTAFTVDVAWNTGGNIGFETVTYGPGGLGVLASPWWLVQIQASQAGTTVSATAQHRVGPHAGDVPLGPFLFATVEGVSPAGGAGADSDGALHPANHGDRLALSVFRTPAGQETIRVQLVHDVPEPGTWALGALGLGLVALRRRRLLCS
jgi:MYXO-CTERM domain-containing protein